MSYDKEIADYVLELESINSELREQVEGLIKQLDEAKRQLAIMDERLDHYYL
jgi:DNA integrity scanning protein DisA with diadenylate cyclase activity